jgi:hypothetical protein
MNISALSGQDTIVLNGRVLVDLADGNVCELTFPNDIAAVKTGKNGNSLYALNESGKQADVKLRIVRGSDDDKYLLNLLNNQQNNFVGTVLLTGQFVKKIGDGAGNITNDIYNVSGGIFKKQVPGTQNVEGDTSQAVADYEMVFSNGPRALA